MPILKNYHHFDGLHWETGFLCNALAYQGVIAPHTGKPYTEAMLMGIAGGLCAGYFAFEYTGEEPHLHLLTRYPFNENLPNADYERLGIPTKVQQTPDPEKAVANVINVLVQGKPVIVWVDVMSFDEVNKPSGDFWFITPILVYGYDEAAGTVYIADRAQVSRTVTTAAFAAARARIKKIRHKIMTIDAPDPHKLPAAIEAGIRDCIQIFTDKPPVGPKSSFGFDAFTKWANLLTDTKNKNGWPKQFATGARMYAGLTSAFRYIEVWFTGGNGARNLYADFLDEAAEVLAKPELKEVAAQFRISAQFWHELTTALLPDQIAVFKETRELMVRSYDLFLSQGTHALPERQQIRNRLEAIKAEIAKEFPLSESQAAAMRAELRERVLKIHDAEHIAIDLLSDLMR